MFFDPLYFVFILPAVGLMLWAQWRVKATYAQGDRIGANLSGAAAARHILDAAGLHNVGVEQTEGFLSDHYDPRAKVLRLSPGVYNNRTASAVGIAAHEAGHALQDAEQYGPLVVRNFAVPIATLGSSVVNFVMMAAFGALFIGAGKLFPLLLLAALGGYVAILAFQLVNLPVEFDASNRAKALVNEMGIVDASGGVAVNKVLGAAGWTYVAAMLQTLMTVLYYVFILTGRGGSDE